MTDTTEQRARLRDEFAMAALTGCLASEDYQAGQNYWLGADGEARLAERAYSIADAMLKERDRND